MSINHASPTIRVGYNRSHAILMMCLGILCCLFGVVYFSVITTRSMVVRYAPLMMGAGCMAASIAMIVRPRFELGRDRITVFAVLGALGRDYGFGSLDQVRIVRGRVVVGSRLLPIHKAGCDPRGWAPFEAAVTAARGGELPPAERHS